MPWLDPDDEVLQTARVCAELTKLACEEDEDRLRPNLLGCFHQLELLPLGLGFVAGSDRHVVVAFAGTRDAIDWAFNVVHLLAPGYGGRVHKGFAHLAEHVGDTVTRAVQKALTSRQRVVVTGHSRGGALAVLTAYRLDVAGIAPEHVFTFGAPRVGDAAFASAYRPPLFGLEATHDPVPSLPPFPDYEATGHRLLLTQGGRVYQTDGSWVDNLTMLGEALCGPVPKQALDCHRIEYYLKQLGAEKNRSLIDFR